ncbi:hypothetical protein [Streptomyces sp. NBC_01240]|uniref:hypothetical protein n=1 Tax=Streptomyces sp. NBC_01240 TaxID=2903793 RepID=UPI002E153F7B|nr:hypothetical protein OG466_39375 [Streptomyces sp. NBC_01240]
MDGFRRIPRAGDPRHAEGAGVREDLLDLDAAGGGVAGVQQLHLAEELPTLRGPPPQPARPVLRADRFRRIRTHDPEFAEQMEQTLGDEP